MPLKYKTDKRQACPISKRKRLDARVSMIKLNVMGSTDKQVLQYHHEWMKRNLSLFNAQNTFGKHLILISTYVSERPVI